MLVAEFAFGIIGTLFIIAGCIITAFLMTKLERNKDV